MTSGMSKYKFVRSSISILMSKIISGTWRPLEADLGVVQMVAYQRLYFLTFSIINISNFFFKMTVLIEINILYSSFWYKSSFYNLYFDSWKYEEKRRDQFNDSPTMPEPRQLLWQGEF